MRHLTAQQLTNDYAEAVRNLPPTDDWREERARLARQFADDSERAERRERVPMHSEDEPMYAPVGSGKPAEKFKNLPAGLRI